MAAEEEVVAEDLPICIRVLQDTTMALLMATSIIHTVAHIIMTSMIIQIVMALELICHMEAHQEDTMNHPHSEAEETVAGIQDHKAVQHLPDIRKGLTLISEVQDLEATHLQ